MATIIAGGFKVHEDAQAAIEALRAAGVGPQDIFTFRVNPPGEHNSLPLGGDRDKSPGAKDADGGAVRGAAIGAVAGAAAGAAAAPLVGPIAIAAGAGVGAYTGSLVGALGAMERTRENDVRPAESLVAVNADPGAITTERIIEILEQCHAQQVERAEGRWENGEWADFDPLSRPHLLH